MYCYCSSVCYCYSAVNGHGVELRNAL